MSGQSVTRTGANAYTRTTYVSRNNAGSGSGINNSASAIWGFPTGTLLLEPTERRNRQITIPVDTGQPPPDTSLMYRSRLIYRFALCLSLIGL